MPNSGHKPKVVFFGNERLATGVTTSAPVLRMLIDEGYDVCALVVHNTKTRSRNTRDLEVATLAQAHNIPIISSEAPAEIIDKLSNHKATAGILVAYGKIIPAPLIDLFPSGIINVHPSLLPKHRGPTPIESAILTGDKETGVSIMKISSKMDAGPIFAQSPVPLTGKETKQALADSLSTVAAEILRAQLHDMLNGTVVAQPQNDAQATYDRLIDKQASLLDTTKPAAVLEREIRAFAGWPGSKLKLGDMDIVITKALLVPSGTAYEQQGTVFALDKQLYLRASDGLLRIDALKPAGKPEMTAQAFLAGYRQKITLYLDP